MEVIVTVWVLFVTSHYAIKFTFAIQSFGKLS